VSEGTVLDCHDLKTALATLESLLDIVVEELSEALVSHDESRFDGTEDPFKRMPNDVANALGANLELAHPAGAYYFHGTRVVDPDSFVRRGILPLGQMVDSIWSTLGDLVRDVCPATEWDEFRRSVERDGAGRLSGQSCWALDTGARPIPPSAIVEVEVRS
jgi:hypothetical protein